MEFVVQGGEPVVLSGHEATQAEVRIKIVDVGSLSRGEREELELSFWKRTQCTFFHPGGSKKRGVQLGGQ